MAEEAHGNPAAEKEAKEAAAEMDDIESRITTAMRSRVGHFKEQSEYPLSLSISLFISFSLLKSVFSFESISFVNWIALHGRILGFSRYFGRIFEGFYSNYLRECEYWV